MVLKTNQLTIDNYTTNLIDKLNSSNVLNSSEDTMYNKLLNKKTTIGVVGLGYIGLPVALEFAKCFNVIGYDINDEYVKMMNFGIDPSNELRAVNFIGRSINFTTSSSDLSGSDFIIVTIPIPVNKNNHPDLSPLKSACKEVGKNLRKGNIVVFESTAYPGCIEEICIPILEKHSKLKYNVDFKIGYSPERINPDNKDKTFETIKKVVSGSDLESKREIYHIYKHIIKAGVHLAPSIKVAEASKIIENIQSDLNVALMNELSTVFEKIGINTYDVLEAASTKSNFLKFYPGLVGGDGIGVDPYYLIHKGSEIGNELNLIREARKISSGMVKIVFNRIENYFTKNGKQISDLKVLFLGATFKENVSDLRNSKSAELAMLLNKHARRTDVLDSFACPTELNKEYGLDLKEKIDSKDYDLVIYAVNHCTFNKLNWDSMKSITKDNGLVFDMKALLRDEALRSDKIAYMTL